jgi:glycosyltransferase involved in cell wall biosynthesis
MFNKKHLETEIRLNVIGNIELPMKKPEFVHLYGYLSKDLDEKYKIYTDLIKNAKALVNINEGWAGAQSILEGMYYRLPAIVNPNDDLIDMFGQEIKCGWYCRNDAAELNSQIEKIMNMPFEKYEIVAKNAYQFARENTWDSCAKKFIQIVKSEL